jgi:alpha-methylacyl-CoA racemase
MGPLHGVRVIELQGIGPAPFAAMMLADMGADVIRVDKLSGMGGDPRRDLLNRGRRSIAVDLKHPDGAETVLRLVEGADALLEGFRPGVMERLGLGPEDCLARNPRLVYGRMTGWGQEGPYASMAGHDIDYIAIGGALANFRRAGDRPVPPMNLVGDFGGGGMLLAFGVLCGLLEARSSGQGQVVDAAMVDGTAALLAMPYSFLAMGIHDPATPGGNLLDTGAHFYEVYDTADGKFVAVGAIEPQFYAALLKGLGLEGEQLPFQMDKSQWPAMKERFAMIFKTKTREEWEAVFEGTDACVAPVLELPEAPGHHHNVARGTFVEDENGFVQPGPAPRFSRTKAVIEGLPPKPGEHSDEILGEVGLSDAEIAKLREAGAVA